MNEEVELYIEEGKDLMGKALKHLHKNYSRLRTGKANPKMLDGVTVDYYGAETPLKNAANVSASDYRTLVIQPYEKTMIKKIEKAIMDSDLGLNPQNNGDMIFINIPALTEERRKELVKFAKKELEDAKISIRNARREVNQQLKEAQNEGVSEDEVKEGEEKVEALTKNYTEKAENIFEEKENEIMEV